MVYPVRKVPGGNTVFNVGQDTGTAREWNQDNKRRSSVAAKDSEAQWQDVSQEKSTNHKMMVFLSMTSQKKMRNIHENTLY